MYGMLSNCLIKGDNIDVLRKIGFVPFIARFDPWVEFMGYIRDVENA
jgi:hypothetical protein